MEKSGTELRAGLITLAAALDSVGETPLWRVPDSQLLEGLRQLEVLTARLESKRLALVREVDSRGVTVAESMLSTAAWLRDGLRRHPGAASRDVTLARALAGELSATGAALAAGQVSREHADVILRTLAALPADVAGTTLADAEGFLLGQAQEQDPLLLSRLGRHVRHHLDPDAGARLARDEAAALGRRELFVSPDGPGGFVLRGWLDPVGGAALLSALSPLAAPRPSGADGADLRSPAKRRADALVELVERALRAGELPGQGGQRPQVTVTVELATLRRDLGAVGAVLDWAGPVSAETSRLLACDASVIPVVLGARGEPLDVGRATPTPPAALRRAVLSRDGGCAFPGCDRPAGWCDVHHCRHWADGGSTALDNLVTLCRRHHTAVHHHGWDVVVAADGFPEFTPPPWIDPGRTPRRRPWREQLRSLAPPG